MWVRRQADEVDRNRRKKYISPKLPFICASFIFLLSLVSIKIGFSAWKPPSPYVNPISWHDFFSWGFWVALCIGGFFFLIFYAWQFITKRPMMNGERTLICMKCNRVKNYDNVLSCSCGGEFIYLDEMKWTEDNPRKQEPSNPSLHRTC